MNPYLWQISEGFGVRWFGVASLAAFVLTLLLVIWLGSRQQMGLTRDLAVDFVLSSLISIFVTARFGYCILYAPDLFIKFRSGFPFWGILAIDEGGLSIHGAMIGVVLNAAFFAWRKGISLPYLLDISALVGALQIFFLRAGYFINGQQLGKPATDFPYAMKFPQEILWWMQNEPQKLLSLDPVIAVTPGLKVASWPDLVTQVSNPVAVDPGVRDQVIGVLEQIIQSIQSGNAAVRAALEPLLVMRYPAQAMSAVSEGLILFFCLFFIWYKPQRSGMIASLFMVLYSVARIVDENYRLPDWNVGYQWFNLTRGQWFSIVTLAIGFWMLAFYGRRGAISRPGWGTGPNVRLHRR